MLRSIFILILLNCIFIAEAQLYSSKGKKSFGIGVNFTVGLHLSSARTNKFYFETHLNAGYLYKGNYVGLSPQAQYAFKFNTFSTIEKGFSHQFFGSLQFPVSIYHGESKSRLYEQEFYFQPFYAFADLAAPAIKNLYHGAITPGVQLIRIIDNNKEWKRQRVMTVNIKYGEVHLYYENDGKSLCIGDENDRWYTSSILLAWHRNNHQAINHYAISYNRFTGYTPFAYEVSKRTGANHVDYKDQKQIKYNEDYWKATIGHNQLGTVNVRFINFKFKLLQGQDAVHYLLNMPYHIDNSKPRISLDVQSAIFIQKHTDHAHN